MIEDIILVLLILNLVGNVLIYKAIKMKANITQTTLMAFNPDLTPGESRSRSDETLWKICEDRKAK